VWGGELHTTGIRGPESRAGSASTWDGEENSFQGRVLAAGPSLQGWGAGGAAGSQPLTPSGWLSHGISCFVSEQQLSNLIAVKRGLKKSVCVCVCVRESE
jgi:hypothetical protein